MSEHFTLNDLEALVDHQGKPAVSIYLPTTRIPTRVQAESLQFKNLLREAEEQLSHFDVRGPAIREMLEPSWQLVSDTDFWRHQLDGLVVFASENHFARYQVPITFETTLFVGEAFHLKPLLPLVTNDPTFYILAISQNRVRLLRGTRYAAEELDPANLPEGLQEVLSEYVLDKQLQFHTQTSTPAGGRRDAMYFGSSGAESDNDKVRIAEYFRRIDRALVDYLGDQSAPLIFVGVEYLFPIYQEANTYPNLVERNITGNPDEMQPEDLRQRAWRLVERSFIKQREADLETFYEAAPRNLTATSLTELVPWADKGRVDTLFIDKEASSWGTYDRQAFEATAEATRTPHNRDLTDMAAVFTALRGGRVYLLTPEEMAMEFGPTNRHHPTSGNGEGPSATPAAAGIYRFAL